MNTALLLEVLLSAFIVLSVLSLFSLHYSSLQALLLNERESRRIVGLISLSDRLVSGELAEIRMGVRVNNVVDCSRISCEGGIYVRCGPFSCGEREGKLVMRRLVVYGGVPSVLEVGIP